jgi:hypothetical protein
MGDYAIATVTSMLEPFEFEWDENKRRINVVKHGIDFEDAKRSLL